MKRRLQNWVVLLLAALASTGCYNTVEQALYQGNYDQVLQSSLDKIAKSRKKDEYIDMALKAYNKVFAEDQFQVKTLKGMMAGRPDATENWPKIYYTYRRMIARQNTILPYLPFTYMDGSTVDIPVYDLQPVLEEARINAAEHHYQRALKQLADSSRLSARRAYEELRAVSDFARDYKDAERLMARAADAGTNKVLLHIRPVGGLPLPDRYLEALDYFDYEQKVDGWSQLYRQAEEESDFDFAVDISIRNVSISPEQVKEVHFKEEKTIEDGHQPLLDSEGQYVVDSLGNTIQVPRYRTLVCYVTEWTQVRSITVESIFEIRNLRSGELVGRKTMVDHADFENSYATANGHIDILPSAVKRKLNARPVPFPDDTEMLLMTAESLKRQIAGALSQNRDILASIAQW